MALQSVGIIGAGAWGTALAVTSRRAGRDVLIWAYELETLIDINEAHRNGIYLPGVSLDRGIEATAKFNEVANCDLLLMLKKALIGFGILFAILIGIVFALGFFTPDGKSVSETVSMSVGSRTVTVGGHYKDMTQESLADGMKIIVDGHKITISADQLEVDGKTQVLEPGQDVEITVDAKGAVSEKVVASGGGTGNAPQ